ncbi:MAG: hypothetical protein RIT24_371 [Planctomycetota bacterium]
MSAPLGILVVATRFPLASETFVRQQCIDLLRAGHRVTVLALNAGDGAWTAEEEALGLPRQVRVAAIDASIPARLARLPARLVRTALRSPAAAIAALSPFRGRRALGLQLLAIGDALHAPRSFDAIHCQFGPAGAVAAEAIEAGLLRGTLGVGFYGYDLTREPRRRGADCYAQLFRHARLLLPHSEYLAGRLRELGAPPERIVLHRLGVDLARFPFVDRSARTSPPVALAVGRFVEKKGFEYLIRGLAAAANPPRLRLVGDGPLRPALVSLARELGVEQRIEFAGWRSFDEVAAEMRNADFLIAPSVTAADGDMEGLPLVIIEAMATGLPVIGSHHSGIPELVVDGETGITVPERDAAAVGRAIEAMSERPFRTALARAARTRVEREFDGHRLAERLCALYRGQRA